MARIALGIGVILAMLPGLAEEPPRFTNADLERYGASYAAPSRPPESALPADWGFVERMLDRELERNALVAERDERRLDREANDALRERAPRYSVPSGGVYGWAAVWNRWNWAEPCRPKPLPGEDRVLRHPDPRGQAIYRPHHRIR